MSQVYADHVTNLKRLLDGVDVDSIIGIYYGDILIGTIVAYKKGGFSELVWKSKELEREHGTRENRFKVYKPIRMLVADQRKHNR